VIGLANPEMGPTTFSGCGLCPTQPLPNAPSPGALTPKSWTDQLLNPPAPAGGNDTNSGSAANNTLLVEGQQQQPTPPQGRPPGQPAPLITPDQAVAAAVAAALEVLGPTAPSGLQSRLRAAAAAAASDPVGPRPSLVSAALEAALADLPGAVAPSAAAAAEPRAQCFRDGACGLMHELPLRLPPLGATPPRDLRIFVDASDGSVVSVADALRSAAASAARPASAAGRGAVGRGGTLWKLNRRGRVAIDVVRTGEQFGGIGAFQLVDSKHYGSSTLDFNNARDVDAPKGTSVARLFSDSDNRWCAGRGSGGGEIPPNGQGGARF
jgi:hypothetical protein